MNAFETARRELGWSMELVANKARCHLGTVAAAEGRSGKDPLSVKARTARDIGTALCGGDEFLGLRLTTEWISETTSLKGKIVVRFAGGEDDIDQDRRIVG